MSPKQFVPIFFVICLGLILASAVIWEYWVPKVYAEEYFWFYDEPWNTAPIVCIGQPINMTYTFQYLSKYKMLDAINSWEEKLNNYTQTDNFNIKIFMPRTIEQLSKCNVTVLFLSSIPDEQGSKYITMGQAICETNDDKQCNILIAEKWLKKNKNPMATLKHEFGHVLGLGHREGDTIYEKANTIKSFDIMIYQIGKWRVITDEDLEALIAIYGIDGWKEPNNPIKHYEISR